MGFPNRGFGMPVSKREADQRKSENIREMIDRLGRELLALDEKIDRLEHGNHASRPRRGAGCSKTAGAARSQTQRDVTSHTRMIDQRPKTFLGSQKKGRVAL